MAKFIVEGSIRLEAVPRPFTKEVEAKSESMAKDRIYTLFGSNNGLQRSKIKITSIKKG